MARREFPRAVKVAKLKSQTRNGVAFCEACALPAKRFHFDHHNPDGLTGEPTLENCRLLCEACHAEKTKADVANIARAKRREAAHLGVRKPASLKGQSFVKAQPQQRASKPLTKHLPPRRPMYETTR